MLKNASKRAVQKITEVTGDLIDTKTAEAVAELYDKKLQKP